MTLPNSSPGQAHLIGSHSHAMMGPNKVHYYYYYYYYYYFSTKTTTTTTITTTITPSIRQRGDIYVCSVSKLEGQNVTLYIMAGGRTVSLAAKKQQPLLAGSENSSPCSVTSLRCCLQDSANTNLDSFMSFQSLGRRPQGDVLSDVALEINESRINKDLSPGEWRQ